MRGGERSSFVTSARDQHGAHEVNAKGKLVCSRRGAAADFIVEDENMYEVMKWIHENLLFDRMYYYGPDRPLHVSFSETPATAGQRGIASVAQVTRGAVFPSL
jgi:hypothetical protein